MCVLTWVVKSVLALSLLFGSHGKMWSPVNLTSRMFYVFSHKSSSHCGLRSGGAVECELFENGWFLCEYVHVVIYLCAHLFCIPLLSSPLQPVTWAVIAVRSQICWIRASRSAHSVSSSQPTTASSSCVAFGTRASGFTPPTQVLCNQSKHQPSCDYHHINLYT